MRFSVVIPTLNEATIIEQQIIQIRRLNKSAEIIVADGGSSDETVQLAEKHRAKVIHSRAGRGTQLRTGAEAASGDILVFLHADTVLPGDAFNVMTDFFSRGKNLIATFRIHFYPPYLILRMISSFTRFDTIITKFGDQSIVIKRSFYDHIGGFPDYPLFEDIYLLENARKHTSIRSLPSYVISSSRRFKRNGVARQLIWNAWLVLLYYAGWSPDKLSEMYRRKL